MQIYSGGLGVLAGDHCKSASDAALPFIGIGLLYRRGYFRQQIDADGHQEHAQPDLDPAQLPLRRARGLDGAPLEVSVEIADRSVHAAVWVAQVGRVPILLLDTDIAANDKADRPITHILYVRGREMRLCQELVLGIGGVRALRALGHRAGHLAPQRGPLRLPAPRAGTRARRRRARDGRRSRRCVASAANSVFTIHTPVPAGNEVFGRDLVAPALASWFDAAGAEPIRVPRPRSRAHRGARRAVRHDGLRPAPRHAGRTRFRSSTAPPPPRPGRSSPAIPSAPSRTASTSRPGSAGRCAG